MKIRNRLFIYIYTLGNIFPEIFFWVNRRFTFISLECTDLKYTNQNTKLNFSPLRVSSPVQTNYADGHCVDGWSVCVAVMHRRTFARTIFSFLFWYKPYTVIQLFGGDFHPHCAHPAVSATDIYIFFVEVRPDGSSVSQ